MDLPYTYPPTYPLSYQIGLRAPTSQRGLRMPVGGGYVAESEDDLWEVALDVDPTMSPEDVEKFVRTGRTTLTLSNGRKRVMELIGQDGEGNR